MARASLVDALVHARTREKRHEHSAGLVTAVLRSADVDGAVAFYEALGVRFQAEQHGSGPRHFAAEWGGLVLEIYPESEQSPAEHSTRLGFIVDDIDNVRRQLIAAGGTERSFDSATPVALYADPDGRAIEIRGR